MQPNHAIETQEELLSHFDSSQKLEILDSEQIEDLLALNIPPEVWEDAFYRNSLFFNQEFVQRTKELSFQSRWIQYFHLMQFLTNLNELSLYHNKISNISSISNSKT
ncbi:Leucine-rich_repeat [Hexamita inflata]|uniref:Leucine-rich repeat n=1 Tax=Hexamita inflata TaxID=28002 RepID=A0AA86T8P3_9EUKA|nr:Leucine-rich repeat [Hexamita inflata]